MTPIRLQVDMQGASKEDVVDRCWLQARQFFGKEDHWLDMPIDVEVFEETKTVQGQVVQLTWEARAYFVNYGEKDQTFL